MGPIRLYDASTGELAPVLRGDAIRVEIHTANLADQGQVDVASTRPFVLFSLLQRLLRSEGLPTRFLFGSPGAGELLRELDMDAEPDGEQESGLTRTDGATGMQRADGLRRLADREDGRQATDGGERDGPAPGGRCVDIRFGAAREGEEWAGGEPAGRITLRQALRRFGHRALAFYLMGTHYSQPLGDPVDGLRKASAHVLRLSQTQARLRPEEPSPPELRHHVRDFFEALATDLDTPGALVALFQWVLATERHPEPVGGRDLRAMLGLLELDDLTLVGAG